MVLAVPRAIPDESAPNGVRTIYTLPNLRRLRDVVRQYISMDRITPS